MYETMYVVMGLDNGVTWLVGVFRSVPESDMAIDWASAGYKGRNPDKPDPIFYTTNVECGKPYQEHQIQVQLH